MIIGTINWGLIGFFQFDLVIALFGGQDAGTEKIVYALVGLSGLFCLTILFSPMDEENVRNSRNLNYSTELGEETDLSDTEKQKYNS
ncbi:hypothetical protein GCM10007063_03940 [Lentibacillus kapialis]|uniref:DUF378 domain-containing protein n=1 Tax=Lentibacillus kapialis TaxID=340214 RepID=A0A917PN44_9BACI|nr:DUF378 domain-containing protein [Lentibacillus kapialis]GGJ84662.1 hypothetical protein GCM10007063_03940 [Lentibacillus kapialis]